MCTHALTLISVPDLYAPKCPVWLFLLLVASRQLTHPWRECLARHWDTEVNFDAIKCHSSSDVLIFSEVRWQLSRQENVTNQCFYSPSSIIRRFVSVVLDFGHFWFWQLWLRDFKSLTCQALSHESSLSNSTEKELAICIQVLLLSHYCVTITDYRCIASSVHGSEQRSRKYNRLRRYCRRPGMPTISIYILEHSQYKLSSGLHRKTR